MARVYEATDELTHVEKDHLFLKGHKDNTAEDKKLSSENFMQSFLLDNDIINGSFDLWQRFYTSKAALANGNYLADRFAYEKSGTMVHSCFRETTIKPTDSNASLHLDCTTADVAIAAGAYCALTHIIEGYNIHKYIVNGFLCLGMWLRSPKSGTFCIAIRNDGKNRSYVSEVTMAAADTLEFHTIVVPMDFVGGTWDYENGAGLRISWVLAAGVTYQTTKDAWQTGNFFATASQQNLCDNVANNFYIGLVTSNPGKLIMATNAVFIGKEIVRAQRYYEKSYNGNTDPGSAVSIGALVAQLAASTTFLSMQKAFAAKKRTVPTVSWYSDNTGNINRVYDNTPVVGDKVVSTTAFAGEYSSGIPVLSLAGTDGHTFSAHYTIDAEISV